MRRLLALLSLLVTLPALAAPVTVRWTNPTSYVDDSALASADITRTRIEYGSCVGAAFGTKAGEFISAGNDTSEVSPSLAPGTHCFRAYTTAKGVESATSNVSSAVVPQPAPKPPTLLDAILAWIKSAWSRWFA